MFLFFPVYLFPDKSDVMHFCVLYVSFLLYTDQMMETSAVILEMEGYRPLPKKQPDLTKNQNPISVQESRSCQDLSRPGQAWADLSNSCPRIQDLSSGCPGIQDLSSGCPGSQTHPEKVLFIFVFPKNSHFPF